MHNAVMAVSAFAAQRQFASFQIEVGAPGDQLTNSLRGFADDHFDHRRIAQLAAGGKRVGNVIFEPVFRIDHTGDAPLSIRAVRLRQRFLGDHQHRKRGINRIGRPQSG